MYSDGIEAGTVRLRPRDERRLRRAIDRGNRGNMQRALAFASADGPRRSGLAGERAGEAEHAAELRPVAG